MVEPIAVQHHDGSDVMSAVVVPNGQSLDDPLQATHLGRRHDLDYQHRCPSTQQRNHMERMFSAREGVGIEDTLPERLLTEPTPSCGGVVDLYPMLGEYYYIRGWVDGVPTPERLAYLGLPPLP